MEIRFRSLLESTLIPTQDHQKSLSATKSLTQSVSLTEQELAEGPFIIGSKDKIRTCNFLW